jgi:hypothetical protein
MPMEFKHLLDDDPPVRGTGRPVRRDQADAPVTR